MMKPLESELISAKSSKIDTEFIQQIETHIPPTLLADSRILVIAADNFALLLSLAKKYPSLSWQAANVQSEFIGSNSESLAGGKNILPLCDWRLNTRKHLVDNYDGIICSYPLRYLPWEEVKNLFYYFNKALNNNGSLIVIDCFIDTLQPINKYLADLDKSLRLKNKDYSVRDINVIKTLAKMQKLTLNEDIVLDEFHRFLRWTRR